MNKLVVFRVSVVDLISEHFNSGDKHFDNNKLQMKYNRYTKHHQLIHLLVSICRASPQKPATIMRLQLQPLPPCSAI